MSSYYPHGGPKEFSYVTAFLDKFPKTGAEASQNTQFAGSIAHTVEGIASTNLQSLISIARANENAFLAKHKLPNANPNNWTDLFKAFNEILQTESVFERNLTLIAQTNQNVGEDLYRSMETYFSSYLQTAARDLVSKNINNLVLDDKFLNKVIDSALKRMKNAKDYIDSNGVLHPRSDKKGAKDTTKTQAYKQLLEIIYKFRDNEFLSNVKELFNLKEFLQETINATNNHTAKPVIKSSVTNNNVKGAIGEYFSAQGAAAMLNYLKEGGNSTIQWKATGNFNEMKADAILYEGNINLLLNNLKEGMELSDSNSVRAQNVQAFNHLFAKLEELKEAKGEIIQINDKNYTIQPGFKGFHAQDVTTLENIDELFANLNMDVNREELVNYLANCGPDMIQGEVNQNLITVLTMNIGHFLFDDLTVTIPGGITNVHVLYLSGIYLPLSVFLEAILQAILESQSKAKDFVHINIQTPAGTEDAASPWSGKEDFTAFRNSRLKKTQINISFLSSFSSFITNLAKGNI